MSDGFPSLYFHKLAFRLLGRELFGAPPTWHGYRGDPYLTEQDYGTLGMIVCERLAHLGLAMRDWWEAGEGARIAYMEAAIQKGAREGDPSALHQPREGPQATDKDLEAAHRGVAACLSAVKTLRDMARHSSEGVPVSEQAVLRGAFDLDRSLIDAERLCFGPGSVHDAVVELARSAIAAFHQGVADLRQSPDAPAEGWQKLWRLYGERFGVYLTRPSDPDRPPTLAYFGADRGGIFRGYILNTNPFAQPDHPWHPGAWPFVCARLAQLPPLDAGSLNAQLEQEYSRAGKNPEGADAAPENRRPCYDRDHTWLRWEEEEGMKPAAIRDRWNREHAQEHIGTGESGRDVVKKGIAKARAERDPE